MCVGFQRLGPLSYGTLGPDKPNRHATYVLRLSIWV